MNGRLKLVIIVGGTVLLGAAIVVGGSALMFRMAFSDMCGNRPVAEYPSPKGTSKVIVFQRDCGATTGFSTQASLISSSAKLPNEAGNLFIADTDHGAAPAAAWGGPAVEVRWLNPRALAIQHHERARISKAERRLHGVEVQYSRVR